MRIDVSFLGPSIGAPGGREADRVETESWRSQTTAYGRGDPELRGCSQISRKQCTHSSKGRHRGGSFAHVLSSTM